MNIPVEVNSEASFVLASVMEFLHVWRSGRESSLSLHCKEGKTVLNFQACLGRPDQSHFQHGRGHGKRKSASRRQKDNARAAAFRAAQSAQSAPVVSAGLPSAHLSPPSPPTPARPAISPVSSTSFPNQVPPTSPPVGETRRVTSPVPPSSLSTRPRPTFQAATSQETCPEIITQSGKRRKVWEPSELDSTIAGQRETLPLSPVDQQRQLRHLFSPGVQREDPQSQDTSLKDSPHPIIDQEPSSPTQSSPWAEQEVSLSMEQEVSPSAEQEVSQSNLQRSILPSPEPGEESSGPPIFNTKKFQTATQYRNSLKQINKRIAMRERLAEKLKDKQKAKL